MDEIIIELAVAGDCDTLAAMYSADMQELGVNQTPEDLRRLVSTSLENQGSHSFTWVARVSDGAIAGVLLAAPFWSLKVAGRALWIEELYVPAEYRRRGIARQLVDFCMDWADDNGFEGVELEAYRMNTAASCLYRALGFRRLAHERYCFHFEVDG